MLITKSIKISWNKYFGELPSMIYAKDRNYVFQSYRSLNTNENSLEIELISKKFFRMSYRFWKWRIKKGNRKQIKIK